VDIIKTKKSSGEIIVLGLVAIIIMLIYLRYLDKLYLPYVLPDEFGYFSNAAYFAGYNWSNVIGDTQYYSFGYSFVLTPLMYLVKDPIIIYRIAIVLNAVFMTVSFFLAYIIAKKISPGVNYWFLVGITFCVSVYPSYLQNSQFALTECLLLLICWLLLWNFININVKSRISLFIFMGLLVGYSFMVHQRTLGILVAASFVMIIMKLNKKIHWKQLIAFFVPLGIMLLLFLEIKSDLMTSLWAGSRISTITNFSGQIPKILRIFTAGGFLRFLSNISGHIFYIGAATYLIGYIGIYRVFKDIFLTVKVKRNSIKQQEIYYEESMQYYYFKLFLITAFVMTVGISAVFMVKATRIDTLMYGRYFEILLPPFLLIGILHLMTCKKDYRSIGTMATIIVVSGFIINWAISYYKMSSLNPFTTVALFPYYNYGVFNAFWAVCITILGGLILYYLFNSGDRISENVRNYAALLLICSSFLFVGNYPVSKYIIGGHSNNIKFNKFIKYENNFDLPVYYLMTGVSRQDMPREYLQFLMKDKPLYYIGLNELDQIKGDAFLIIQSNDTDELLKKGYSKLFAVNKVVLLRKSSYEKQLFKTLGFSNVLNYVMATSEGAVLAGDSYIEMEDPQTKLGENIEVGMNLWLNMDQMNENDARIITKLNDWQKDMSFDIVSKKDSIAIIFSPDGAKWEGLFLKKDAIPANQWNNLRIAFNGGHVSVYVNNSLVGEKQLTFSKIFVGNTNLEVGKNMEGQIRNFHYNAD